MILISMNFGYDKRKSKIIFLIFSKQWFIVVIYSGLVNFLQLKKLEAYGFKSFADKIEVDFDRGITAIVGPNGSGKSNISDAIKWVLGEQNVRNIRGVKAEDIIFAGSESRRAMGVAEPDTAGSGPCGIH